MKKFLLLGLLLTAVLPFSARAEQVAGPTNQILCNRTAQASPATATTTLVITGSTGQTVNICGWHVTSTQATSTTFQFEYGTGATCGTGTNTITPAFNVTSTAPSADRQAVAYITLPIANSLCVVSTGTTVGLAIMVWYSLTP